MTGETRRAILKAYHPATGGRLWRFGIWLHRHGRPKTMPEILHPLAGPIPVWNSKSSWRRPPSRRPELRDASARGAPACRPRYHGDDAATAKSFRDGWFYPEDVGHLGEEGDLRFDGRTDEMMMLSSINIFPAEIESVAEKLPGVVDCAAFSIKSDEFGEIPLVAIVSDGSTTPGEILVGTRKALGTACPASGILRRSDTPQRRGQDSRETNCGVCSKSGRPPSCRMTSRSLAECYRIVAEAMNTSSASIPPVEPSSIAVTDDTFGNWASILWRSWNSASPSTSKQASK